MYIEDELKAIQEDGEKWAQIPEFSRYWISNLGNVFDSRLHKSPYIETDSSGYKLVSLRRDDNVVKSKRVHRLVAEAFLSDWNPEWPWTVNHINGNKADNRLCNLEMLTTQDNSLHYRTAECFEESREAARAHMSAVMKEKCADPEYNKLMSSKMKEVWADPENREMYIDCLYKRQADPANRKRVSDKLKEICADPEYKRGMSERQKANWNNPEYRQCIVSQNQDRIWVHNDSEEKWIHQFELDSYLSNGYKQGRLPSDRVGFTTGKVRIHKDGLGKFVPKDELSAYLSDGWKLGHANKKQVRCIQTGIIYNSVEECASAFGVSPDLIRSKCKKLTKTSYKLKDVDFDFYEEPRRKPADA